jgi:hypothetical protein
VGYYLWAPGETRRRRRNRPDSADKPAEAGVGS